MGGVEYDIFDCKVSSVVKEVDFGEMLIQIHVCCGSFSAASRGRGGGNFKNDPTWTKNK